MRAVVILIVEIGEEPGDTNVRDVRFALSLEAGQEEILDVARLPRTWKSGQPRLVRGLDLEMMLIAERTQRGKYGAERGKPELYPDNEVVVLVR